MFKLFKRFRNRHKKTKLSKEVKEYLKNDINALYGLCVTSFYYEDTDSVKERGKANESNN